MKKSLLCIALAALLVNCKGKDIVTESNLTFQAEEHLKNGTVLGKIDATALKGNLSYELVSQSPANVVAINANGEIIVSDFTKLDFETNPKVNVTVKVKDDKNKNEVNVTINVTDVKAPKEGLMAFFPFNGNANDESGNNRNATIVNPIIDEGGKTSATPGAVLDKDRHGVDSKSYLFQGGAMKVSAFGDNEKQFAISAWIKDKQVSNGYRCIVSKVQDNSIYNRDYTFRLSRSVDGHKLEGQIMSTNNYYTAMSASAVGLGTWQHVVMNYNDGLITLFVNGVSVGQLTATEKIDWDNYNVNIGALNTGNMTETFRGNIDEVMIFKRILTSDEITLLATDKY